MDCSLLRCPKINRSVIYLKVYWPSTKSYFVTNICSLMNIISEDSIFILFNASLAQTVSASLTKEILLSKDTWLL